MPRRYWRARIRDHRDTYDAVILTSVRGSDVANPMAGPYLGPDEPTGQGTEVDLLTSRTTIGATTVRLVDAVAVVAGDPTVLDDPLDYPDEDALLSAGWTPEGDSAPPGAIEWRGIMNVTTPLPVSPSPGHGGLVQAKDPVGATSIATEAFLSKTLTGLTPGALYTASMEVFGWASGTGLPGMVIRLIGATTVTSNIGGNTFYSGDFGTVTATAAADASGQLVVKFGLISRPGAGDAPADFYWWFRDLRVTRTLTANADGTTTPPADLLVTGRVLTAAMADAEARQHLLSRKVIVEYSTDEVP